MSELVRKQSVLSYIERQNKLLYDLITPTENEIINNNNNNNTYITKEFNYYCLETNYTPDKIYKILTDILKHRDFYNIDRCNECILCRNTKEHSITYNTNKIINNKPFIHLSPGKAIDNTSFFVCQHFILEIDKCIRDHKSFSLVFDFESYCFMRMLSDMELAFNLSTILQEAYNTRLDTIYLIDAPFYIKPLLQMMKNMFPDTIYKKIKHITEINYLQMVKTRN